MPRKKPVTEFERQAFQAGRVAAADGVSLADVRARFVHSADREACEKGYKAQEERIEMGWFDVPDLPPHKAD